MSSGKKRPRSETAEDSRAECPFSIRLVDPKERDQKKKKRRRTGDDGEDDTKKIFPQLSPFAPSGKLKTHETMDVHYQVDPAHKWSEMTRYNSFVLNGVKYFSEGFIFVANESTIERQKAVANKEAMQPRKKSDDDWVARILEIRARDEHHVYARVYWMYWPDELPYGTHDGKKLVSGRQPYHGMNELVASNHMDIINVVSVTQQAMVNQWYEENDDDVQSALYWRQALDVRTLELSTVDSLCKCGEPGNPDQTLIGCTAEGCSKWLHEQCLKQEALMRTYERLGKDKPHVKEVVKDEEGGGQAKRPLSPTEPAAGDSAQHSIDVKADDASGDASIKVDDNVDVKQDDEAARESSKQPTEDAQGSTIDAVGKKLPAKRGRPRKSGGPEGHGPYEPKSRPYEGLFDVELKMDLSPPMLEFHDLRGNVTGGEKTWIEKIDCLICGSQVS